ncbi:MAG: hypothetical protein AAB606_00465 [Patescibacteria group bacterium]
MRLHVNLLHKGTIMDLLFFQHKLNNSKFLFKHKPESPPAGGGEEVEYKPVSPTGFAEKLTEIKVWAKKGDRIEDPLVFETWAAKEKAGKKTGDLSAKLEAAKEWVMGGDKGKEASAGNQETPKETAKKKKG